MENYGSFLYHSKINKRKTIRLIESTDKKLMNAELALLFNETCKYIYIQLRDNIENNYKNHKKTFYIFLSVRYIGWGDYSIYIIFQSILSNNYKL